jgi:cytidylate kinase
LDAVDTDGRMREIKNAYIYVGEHHNYFYKQKNITELIDTDEMSATTCLLSQNADFRKIVHAKIAKIIKKHKQIVVEGRDTGTKILPNAQIKIFLNHDYDSRVRNIGKPEKAEFLLKLLK